MVRALRSSGLESACPLHSLAATPPRVGVAPHAKWVPQIRNHGSRMCRPPTDPDLQRGFLDINALETLYVAQE